MRASRAINVYSLGSIPYADCLRLQRAIHQKVIDAEDPSSLFLLEHPPVITLGKHATSADILVSGESLERDGIAVEHIDRGGEATAHEPGQLVVYPVLDLRAFNLGPKAFVSKLEDVVLNLLASYGISAYRDKDFPGVWVAGEKVCAIGIRISRGVSYHGIALNVANSLETFSKIVPCGIQDRGITTVSRLLGKDVAVSELADGFLQNFVQSFEVASVSFPKKRLQLPGV